jgi:hypothetical protein
MNTTLNQRLAAVASSIALTLVLFSGVVSVAQSQAANTQAVIANAAHVPTTA